MGSQVVRFAIAGKANVPWLDQFPDAQVIRQREDYLELSVPDADSARSLLAEAMRRNEPITRFELDYPSLNDIFLDLVRARQSAPAAVNGDAA